MTPEAASQLPTRYAIVGAGPAGLVVGRALKRADIEFDIFERWHEVGGIWNIEQPGSPMYESCNFISSRKRGGFIGYPMPEHLGDFPTWDEVRAYIHQMASDYGLVEHVRFTTTVTDASPVESPEGTSWTVTLDTGETLDYRGVIYAGGHEWKPFVPEIPGLGSFTGRAIHSRDYHSTSEFDGKRVLVVGAGNSGVDIASDAAAVADEAYLSTRRGYWVMPKLFAGVPITDYIDGTEPLPDVFPLSELKTEEERVRFLLTMIGDLTRFGLPAPDHALLSTHPIVSNTVLHYLAHDRLSWRPDIASIDGSRVNFVDGRVLEVDVIVLATGYDIEIPFLAPGLVEYRNGRPLTHLSTFLPGLDGFYTVGIMHVADNGYQNFDEFSQLIVADILATLHGENAENVHRLKHDYQPDFIGDLHLLDTRRNQNQWNAPSMHAVLREIETDFGIPIPRWNDSGFYGALRVTPSPVG